MELIALQSKPQDTSCLPALKVSDIEPKIPFTVLETTLTGWCHHCLMSQRAALLGSSLAAGPAVAPWPAHGLALWPMVLLFVLHSSPAALGRMELDLSPLRGHMEQPPQGWQELLMAAPCCSHTHTLPCSQRSLCLAHSMLLSNFPTFQRLTQAAELLAAGAARLACCSPSLPDFYRIGHTGAMGKKKKVTVIPHNFSASFFLLC